MENGVSDNAKDQPVWSPSNDTLLLVHTCDQATLEVIREFLEPLGIRVEVSSAPDAHPADAD